MNDRVLLVVGMVLLAACTGASRDTVRTGPSETAPESSASANVTITQVRYGGPIFTEGSVSYLAPKQGEQVVFRSAFRNTPMFQSLVDSKPIQSGRYRLTSYQRPCDGSCRALDPPRARCSSELEIARDERMVITIELRLPDRCTIDIEPAAALGTAYPFRLYTHCGIGPCSSTAGHGSRGAIEAKTGSIRRPGGGPLRAGNRAPDLGRSARVHEPIW